MRHSVMALGLVGPVGQEEVVDGVLGVGLDRSVELVVIPDQGQLVELVVVVGVSVADLRSSGERRSFPAAAAGGSARPGRCPRERRARRLAGR